MSEWQPIETAPKDGTAILLFEGMADLYLKAGLEPGVKPGQILGIGMGLWLMTDNEDYWADYHDHDLLMDNPTHWMPLPEPPK